MNILLIGGTGYIGHAVGRQLVSDGHFVSSFARDEYGANRLKSGGIHLTRGDVRSISSVTEASRNADAIVFVAQLPSQKLEHSVVSHILESIRGTKKSFIFTSGTGVLAQPTEGAWSEDTFGEDDGFLTLPFFHLRRKTELLVRQEARRGIRSMVIRPSMVWGGGYHGFVDRALKSIEQTNQSCYVGPGLNLYSSVNLHDLAELYSLAVAHGSSGALYHASSGELNNRTIAELVAQQNGTTTRSVTVDEAKRIWDPVTALAVLSTCSRSRSPRSRQELGWRPSRVDAFDAIVRGAVNSPTRRPGVGRDSAANVFIDEH